MFIFIQCRIKYDSENTAGNNFSDSNCQHHKRNGKRKLVSIFQYEGYDRNIGDNRRKRGKKLVQIANFPCKKRTDKSCQTAENNIWYDASAKNITEQTADK